MRILISLLLISLLSCSTNRVTLNSFTVNNTPSIDRIISISETGYSVLDSQTNFNIIAKNNVEIVVEEEVLVLNEEGRERSLPVIFYDSFQEVKSIKGALFTDSGEQIKTLDSQNIEDLPYNSSNSLYSDLRVKKVSIIHNNYPYILKYRYVLSVNQSMNIPPWYVRNGEEYVHSSALNLTHPVDYEIKIFADDISIASSSTSKKEITKKWSFKGNYEADTGLNPKVLVQPIEFEISGYEGSFDQWSAFGKWYHQINQGRQELSEKTKSEVDEILETKNTKKDQAIAIYSYLQQKTRYVSVQLGIGGWQTFPASFVEKTNYGDCKALTNFTFSIFEYAGIESFPVLLRSGIGLEDIESEFPSQQFNHVILSVPLQDDYLWLECTSQVLPAGYIGNANSAKTGLLITKNGGKLINTPVYDERVNYYSSSSTIELLPNGDAQIDYESISSGIYLEEYVFGLSGKTKDQIMSWLDSSWETDITRYRSVDTESIENKENPNTLKAEFLVKGFANSSGNFLFVPVKSLDRLNFYQNLSTQNPDSYFSFSETDSTFLNFPKEFREVDLPSPLKIEKPFGTYLLEVKRDNFNDQQINIIRSLVFELDKARDKDQTQVADFFNQVKMSDNKDIVIRK